MLQHVRTKVQRNLEYHQNMADFYNKKLEEDSKPAEEQPEEHQNGNGRRRTMMQQAENQHPVPPDEAAQKAKEKEREDFKTIAEMHNEAAKQLRDLLASTPYASAIEDASINRPFLRSDPGMVAVPMARDRVPVEPQSRRGSRLSSRQKMH